MLLCIVVRRRPAWSGPLRLSLAALLLSQTVAYITLETVQGELSPWDFVPLHLCDFAIFVAAYALVTKRRLASELVYFWALAGTTLAIVTPDLSEDFPHARYLFYFGLHGSVVVAAVFLTWGLKKAPRPGAPWRVFLWTNAYAAAVGLVDLVTGANFLYLRAKPDAPTLLDWMGPWPVYILVVEGIALALFALLYLPFWRRAGGALLLALATACGGGDPGGGPDGGSGSKPDAGNPIDCMNLPDPRPSWLETYQTEIVARLSGAQEIAPGLTLADRSTPAARSAARDYIASLFSDLGLEPGFHDYATGTNVYGLLEATVDSDRHLVLGAHFDTVPDSPGANDNATGVAMVVAVARYLQGTSCRNAHVYLVLFDEEEIGLVGSEAFADYLVETGTDVIAAHTVDQNGWDEDGDRAVELERPDAGLVGFYETAAMESGLDVPLVTTQTGATDHVSFRARGFPAVGITEEFVSGDTTPHYHLPSDTFETVNFGYLSSTTALVNYAFARSLADD